MWRWTRIWSTSRRRATTRNGHNRKRVLTDEGAMELEVPRDRAGRFEPRLVEKYCRRLPGFDDKVLSIFPPPVHRRSGDTRARSCGQPVEIAPCPGAAAVLARRQEARGGQSGPSYYSDQVRSVQLDPVTAAQTRNF